MFGEVGLISDDLFRNKVERVVKEWWQRGRKGVRSRAADVLRRVDSCGILRKTRGQMEGQEPAVVGKWEERLLEKKARVEIVSLTLENPTAMAGNREKKVFSRREVRRWGTSSAPFRNDVARYPGSTNI